MRQSVTEACVFAVRKENVNYMQNQRGLLNTAFVVQLQLEGTQMNTTNLANTELTTRMMYFRRKMHKVSTVYNTATLESPRNILAGTRSVAMNSLVQF